MSLVGLGALPVRVLRHEGGDVIMASSAKE